MRSEALIRFAPAEPGVFAEQINQMRGATARIAKNENRRGHFGVSDFPVKKQPLQQNVGRAQQHDENRLQQFLAVRFPDTEPVIGQNPVQVARTAPTENVTGNGVAFAEIDFHGKGGGDAGVKLGSFSLKQERKAQTFFLYKNNQFD